MAFLLNFPNKLFSEYFFLSVEFIFAGLKNYSDVRILSLTKNVTCDGKKILTGKC